MRGISIGLSLPASLGMLVPAAAQAEIPGKVAETFLSQGERGAVIVSLGIVVVVLSGVIAFLFKKLDAQSTAMTGIVKETTTALIANTAATAAGNVAISALDRTLKSTDDGIEKASRQSELAAQEARLRGEAILENQKVIIAYIQSFSRGNHDGRRE